MNIVDWKYLEQVMIGLRFPIKFISRVMQCVINVSMFYLIKGDLTKPFEETSDSGKGAQCSFFLFVVNMKYLSRKLNYLAHQK